MNLAELKKLLDQVGYPVAYSHFIATSTKPVPEPPYITFLETYSTNFKADNQVYKKVYSVDIELYTGHKDLQAESKIEAILDANRLAYETDETFIESENLFQKIYEVRLI